MVTMRGTRRCVLREMIGYRAIYAPQIERHCLCYSRPATGSSVKCKRTYRCWRVCTAESVTGMSMLR